MAGFKDIHTGKFNDVMLIRNNRDMEEFLETYDIKEGEVSTDY